MIFLDFGISAPAQIGSIYQEDFKNGIIRFEDGSSAPWENGIPFRRSLVLRVGPFTDSEVVTFADAIESKVGKVLDLDFEDLPTPFNPSGLVWYLDAETLEGFGAFSENGVHFYEIKLSSVTDRGPASFDCAATFDAPFWSVAVIHDLEVDIPSGFPTGTLRFAKDTRKLFAGADSTKYQINGLKSFQYDYFAHDPSGLPVAPNDLASAWVASTRSAWIFSNTWAEAQKESVPVWMPVVLDDASVGLKSGVFGISLYQSFEYENSLGFLETTQAGIISQNGLSFGSDTLDVSEWVGIMQRGGFSVSLVNAADLQFDFAARPLAGSLVRIFGKLAGEVSTMATGRASSMQHTPTTWVIKCEPELGIDLDATIPIDAGGVAIGSFDYAKARSEKSGLDEYDNGGGQKFLSLVEPYTPTAALAGTIELAVNSVTLQKWFLDGDSLPAYIAYDNGDLALIESYTFLPETPQAPTGRVLLSLSVKVDLVDELPAAALVRIVRLSWAWVVDGNASKAYQYDDTTGQYIEVPAGVLRRVFDGTKTRFFADSDWRNMTIGIDGKIETSSFERLSLEYPAQSLTTATNTGVLGSVDGFNLGEVVEYPTRASSWPAAIALRRQNPYPAYSVSIGVGSAVPVGGAGAYLAASHPELNPSANRLVSYWENGLEKYAWCAAPMSWLGNFPLYSSPIGFSEISPTFAQYDRQKRQTFGYLLRYRLTQAARDAIRASGSLGIATQIFSLAGSCQARKVGNPLGLVEIDLATEFKVETWFRASGNATRDALLGSATITTGDQGNSPKYASLSVYYTKTIGGVPVQFAAYDQESNLIASPFVADPLTMLDAEGREIGLKICTLPASLGGDDRLYNDLEYPSNRYAISFAIDPDFESDFLDLVNGPAVRPDLWAFNLGLTFAASFKSAVVYRSDRPLSGGVASCLICRVVFESNGDLSVLTKGVLLDVTRSSSVFPSYICANPIKCEYEKGAFEAFAVDQDLVKTISSASYFDEIDYLEIFIEPTIDSSANPEARFFYQNSLGAVDPYLRPIDFGAFDDCPLWVASSAVVDLGRDLYVKTNGAPSLDGRSITNPRGVLEFLARRVRPDFSLQMGEDSRDRDNWPARFFAESSLSIREALQLFCDQTLCGVAWDENGEARAVSMAVGDFSQNPTATITPAEVVQGSFERVEWSGIEKTFTAYGVEYNLDQGEFKSRASLAVDQFGEVSASGLLPSMVQSLSNLVGDKMKVGKAYYSGGQVRTKNVSAPWFWAGPVGQSDARISASNLLAKMAERGSFRSWAFSISVKLSLVMGANRVRVGDSISIQTQALSGGLVVPCLLIGIGPDPYTGTARLDLWAAVDPYVFQSVYDYIWDGGFVSDPNYDANARKFSAILDYPFKSGSGAGTFPSGGNVNLIYDQNDYQFQNDSFADSQADFAPFE